MATESSKLKNVPSLIERALEWRLALLLVSLVLAIDVARVPMHALGFPFFNWHASDISLPLGGTLVFAMVYLVFMAGLSPFAQAVLERAAVKFEIQSWLHRWLGRKRDAVQEERMYSHGFAPLDDVEKLALQQRDEFFIKLVKEDRALAKANEYSMRMMASVSFSCGLLMLLDISLIGRRARMEAIQSLWVDENSLWLVLLAVIFFLSSLVLIIWPWWNHFVNGDVFYYERCWIKHPELAAQVVSQKDEKRAAESREQMRNFDGLVGPK